MTGRRATIQPRLNSDLVKLTSTFNAIRDRRKADHALKLTTVTDNDVAPFLTVGGGGVLNKLIKHIQRKAKGENQVAGTTIYKLFSANKDA